MGNEEKEINFFQSWCPQHNVLIDIEKKIFSPVVPKSACTLLRHYIYFIDDSQEHINYKTNHAGQFGIEDARPILREYPNMEGILFVRDPVERFLSGFAEVYYRKTMVEKYGKPNPLVGGSVKLKSDIERELVKNSIEFEHDLLKFLDRSRFNDLIIYCKAKGRVNVHVEPATDIIHWTNLKEYDKFTFFEVDKNLYSNVAHWMRKRGTPLKVEEEVFPNNITLNGLKGFVKGAISMYVSQQQNGILNDLKQYYSKDIEVYELLKDKFYRGSEQ